MKVIEQNPQRDIRTKGPDTNEFGESEIRIDLNGNEIVDFTAFWPEYPPGTWWSAAEWEAGYLPRSK